MKCGVIVNNLPSCPYCSNKEAETLTVLDVDVANIDNEPHFEFIAKCKKCGEKFYYFLDTEMFERKVVDKKSDRYSKSANENVQGEAKIVIDEKE